MVWKCGEEGIVGRYVPYAVVDFRNGVGGGADQGVNCCPRGIGRHTVVCVMAQLTLQSAVDAGPGLMRIAHR